jgi:hypothetical protein
MTKFMSFGQDYKSNVALLRQRCIDNGIVDEIMVYGVLMLGHSDYRMSFIVGNNWC